MGALRSREELGRRLLTLKEQIEKEKTEKARVQGELDSTLSQLKREFKVSSLEEAQAQLVEEENALKQLQQSISTALEELEELMGDG